MRALLTIFFLVICTASLFADESAVLFEQANTFYRSGEYEKAATSYEQIHSQGYEHAALYYNLGNCYFKLKKIPLAIINYERARRLGPGDEDIAHNLRLANLRIVDKIEPIPRLFFVESWYALVNMTPSTQWAIVSIVSLWLSVIVGAIFFLSRLFLFRRMFFFTACALLLLSVLSLICMTHRSSFEENQTEAVLTIPSSPVKSAPDAQSIDLFVLHEGVKVELLDAVGEWKKIRLADGKVGWLPSTSLELI
jgi:tetratricopeptide (TPR) repeat protein